VAGRFASFISFLVLKYLACFVLKYLTSV
jgi:hypothetical protein